MGPSITNNPTAAAQPSTSQGNTTSLADTSFAGASTNVTGFRTNIAALATAGALAFGTNDVANAQTNVNSAVQHGAPTTLATGATNKIVNVSADVLAGQPPANPGRDLVKIKQATVTEFKGLTTVYDGHGRELTLDKSVVPRERDSQSGAPSKGEVLRLLATGIQDLKDKNGGVIPADEVVVVTIQNKFGPAIFPLRADLFPRPDRVSDRALRMADRDQLNHRAITEFSREKGGDLSLRVTHEAGGVASITYDQPIVFELKKK